MSECDESPTSLDAAAVRPADDNIKSSSNTAYTKVVAGEGKSDDYNGCLTTTDETGTGLPDSVAAKEAMHNDDEDAYTQAISQAQEATFPQQLMDLIESETTDDNAVIIRGQKTIEWLSTGDKFIIRDKKALESHVLPKYFKNTCKFMSFVRKLYRWGFRQVEKDFSSNMMIFMHKHFTRGDKRKCLAMRSIVNVKKPQASSIVTLNVSSKRRQDYRDSSRLTYGGDVANYLPQHGNSQIYGGHDSILRSSLGNGGTHNMLNGAINPGLPISYGLLSTQQTHMPRSNYLSNGLDWTVQWPSAVGSLQANQDYSASGPTVSQPIAAGLSNSGRSEEVNLAALIMMEDPTIDAWQALQLAKRHLNGTSTISNMMRPT
jgi:hypothetical protein